MKVFRGSGIIIPMPEERRRYPEPDPSNFASPRAEKMYWETERLLDDSPVFGELEMRYLYDNWHRIQKEFLQKGETEEEAMQIAWGVLAFFVVTRLGEMRLEAETDKQFMKNIPIDEVDIMQAWRVMQKGRYDEETKTYVGEPFFSATEKNIQDIKLHDCPSTRVVDPQNPDSPCFGHLQFLDKAADRQLIPDSIKEAVLTIATINRESLGYEIDFWNEILERELSDKVGAGELTHLLEATYSSMVLKMIRSWNEEERAPRRLELMEVCLSRLRNRENPFQDFLSLKGMAKKNREWRISRGGPKESEVSNYQVPYIALQGLSFSSTLELKRTDEPSYFAVEFEGYKGLDFGLVFSWAPEIQGWVGHAVISHAGKEPPRSITWPVLLSGVKTPAEAAAGLICYYQEHLENFILPKKVTLTEEEKKEVLAGLRKSGIQRADSVDSDTQEKVVELMKLLMREKIDFQ